MDKSSQKSKTKKQVEHRRKKWLQKAVGLLIASANRIRANNKKPASAEALPATYGNSSCTHFTRRPTFGLAD
jgi:hypothetical protein